MKESVSGENRQPSLFRRPDKEFWLGLMADVPTATPADAERRARLALAFMAAVNDLRETTGIPLQLRVGLHTGPVIAGVIGTVRFSYDVWGDTVNTASRMESQGEPGRIQVSMDAMQQLEAQFSFTPRGSIDVKGKGRMDTWWLECEGDTA
ncbi:MAG: adenylate/guanylate cyclase domain-containing protein [Moraxellaceae bacterium]